MPHPQESAAHVGIPAWANAHDIERLRQSVLDLKKSSDRIGRVLVALTVSLVALTVALVVLAIWT